MPERPTPDISAIAIIDPHAVGYRGVPEPTNNVDSLMATCLALKEAIETMARQSGNVANSAVFVRDLENLDRRYSIVDDVDDGGIF